MIVYNCGRYLYILVIFDKLFATIISSEAEGSSQYNVRMRAESCWQDLTFYIHCLNFVFRRFLRCNPRGAPTVYRLIGVKHINFFPLSLLILKSKFWPYVPNLASWAVKGYCDVNFNVYTYILVYNKKLMFFMVWLTWGAGKQIFALSFLKGYLQKLQIMSEGANSYIIIIKIINKLVFSL